jgi:hypothetical protein
LKMYSRSHFDWPGIRVSKLTMRTGWLLTARETSCPEQRTSCVHQAVPCPGLLAQLRGFTLGVAMGRSTLVEYALGLVVFFLSCVVIEAVLSFGLRVLEGPSQRPIAPALFCLATPVAAWLGWLAMRRYSG